MLLVYMFCIRQVEKNDSDTREQKNQFFNLNEYTPLFELTTGIMYPQPIGWIARVNELNDSPVHRLTKPPSVWTFEGCFWNNYFCKRVG